MPGSSHQLPGADPRLHREVSPLRPATALLGPAQVNTSLKLLSLKPQTLVVLLSLHARHLCPALRKHASQRLLLIKSQGLCRPLLGSSSAIYSSLHDLLSVPRRQLWLFGVKTLSSSMSSHCCAQTSAHINQASSQAKSWQRPES